VIDVFAHRGLHISERENTLAAFRAALALGVDGVELDVRRTRDGVLVVHHDPTVDSLAIAQNTRSALPHYVPTLVEALESLEDVAVNVEIKNARGPRRVTTKRAISRARSSKPLARSGRVSASVSRALTSRRARTFAL